MRHYPLTFAVFFVFVLLVLQSGFAQTNETPVITGQVPLTTEQETPLEITLDHLQVTDSDNVYPDGFLLAVSEGNNYTVSGTTVTPSTGFTGTLTVSVTVNDGQAVSQPFDLNISVTAKPAANVAPIITGQVALSTQQDVALTISLADLTVEDPDNTYPDDFSLKVSGGSNYTVSGTTITPSPGFTGVLNVPVTVSDGVNESNLFTLDVTVEAAPVENTPPVISGQKPLTTQEDAAITIEFSDLTVTDPDDTYPDGFTMTFSSGANYSVSGHTITPSTGFTGTLTVPVTVNDGTDSSAPFSLKITVEPKPVENVKPTITGQVALSTLQDTPITIQLSHLTVTDPDDAYPTGFTLTARAGTNYTVASNTVTPAAGFTGTLNVPVIVNDGQADSDPFTLTISVTPKPAENVKPVITGQTGLTTVENTSLTILLSHLTVTDPDDAYPAGFTLQVSAGTNYAVSGTTITPAAGFTGNLTVPVTVNDGEATSDPFNLQVTVTAAQPDDVKPVIKGQNPLTTEENKPIAITLADLTVEDPDNKYPDDFSLTLYSGTNYTINGKNVNPASGFTGTLVVPVSVNDGELESDKFNLTITVTPKKPVNVKPIITGQIPITILNTQSFTITLSHLIVSDPDNAYPTGFTLKVSSGSKYTVNGNTIKPAAGFTGTLTVKVSVNDGTSDSDPFDFKITVTAPAVNAKPVITGQQELFTFPGTPLALRLTHFIVTDPDNTYPDDFKLSVLPGQNYTVDGTTITPSANFLGTLSVSVQVSDGINLSEPFSATISVIEKKQLLITGQKELITKEDSVLMIDLDDLEVNDPSGAYPQGYTMNISTGSNYSINGSTITPVANYSGTLEVPVQISNSTQSSNTFKVIVLVTPVNDKPLITDLGPATVEYSLGTSGQKISPEIQIADEDSEQLVYAEVFIEPAEFLPGKDLLLAPSVGGIRSIFDPNAGALVLLGPGSVSDYQEILKGVQYQYNNDTLPSLLHKQIHFRLNDGLAFSDIYTKTIQFTEMITLDIPNVFTPNDDHKNDMWIISRQSQGDNTSAMIRVFDQRGLIVYESSAIDQPWDGRYKGQTLPSGTYYYTIEVAASVNKISKKGTVTILR